ncbi:NmrA family NAD(P)-binding protein [Streptomyces sp. TRM70308]|uniref:NmrA family NAD(P)-binding protein n=1 Tax=Streptomyces sp. TRM70308 TaxID=3131932 RepID=UPI003D027E04
MVRAAGEAGVRRVVLLSARGRDERRPTQRATQAVEEAVRRGGVGWTVLRASWFMQNFGEGGLLLPPLRAGELALPAGDGGEAFVDAEDVADAAVAALGDDRHLGRVYDLSGPEVLSFGEATARIAAAAGRELRYVPVPAGSYTAALLAHGVPAALARTVTELLERVAAHEVAYLSEGVREVLGRAPRTFDAYVADVAAEGRWRAEPAR